MEGILAKLHMKSKKSMYYYNRINALNNLTKTQRDILERLRSKPRKWISSYKLGRLKSLVLLEEGGYIKSRVELGLWPTFGEIYSLGLGRRKTEKLYQYYMKNCLLCKAATKAEARQALRERIGDLMEERSELQFKAWLKACPTTNLQELIKKQCSF